VGMIGVTTPAGLPGAPDGLTGLVGNCTGATGPVGVMGLTVPRLTVVAVTGGGLVSDVVAAEAVGGPATRVVATSPKPRTRRPVRAAARKHSTGGVPFVIASPHTGRDDTDTQFARFTPVVRSASHPKPGGSTNPTDEFRRVDCPYVRQPLAKESTRP
jgi:hypothetical protein